MGENIKGFYRGLEVLLKLRQHQLDAVEKGFYDELGGAGGPMRTAFGAEAIVIPTGLLSYLGKTVPRTATGTDLPSFMGKAEILKDFWIDGPETSAGPIGAFRRSAPALMRELAGSLTDSDVNTRPYGDYDTLDLVTWRVAALVDLADLFLIENSPSDPRRQGTDDPSALLQDIADRLEALFGSLNDSMILHERPEEGTCLAGWYVTPEATEELRRLLESRVPSQKPLRLSVVNHPNVRTTVLLTSRAIMTCLVVAKSVFVDGDLKGFDTLKTRITDLLGLMQEPQARSFVMKVLADIASLPRITEAHCDLLAHCGALLCLGRTLGMFKRGVKDADKEPIEVWLDVVEGNRRLILGFVDAEKKDLPPGQAPWFLTPTHFVSSTHWEKDFGRSAKDGLTPEELRDLGNAGNAFPFALGLPLFVRALGHLAFETRLEFLRSRKPGTAWDSEWVVHKGSRCKWIDRVDLLLDEFAERMVATHLGPNWAYGFSQEGGKPLEDLSVTAGVVDAYSLHLANRLCIALISSEDLTRDLGERGAAGDRGDFQLPDVLKGISVEDAAAIANFLNLLRRRTTLAQVIPPSEDPQEEAERQKDRAWLATFVRLARLASRIDPDGRPLDWSQLAYLVHLFDDARQDDEKALSGLEGVFRQEIERPDVAPPDKYQAIFDEIPRRNEDPRHARIDAALESPKPGAR